MNVITSFNKPKPTFLVFLYSMRTHGNAVGLPNTTRYRYLYYESYNLTSRQAQFVRRRQAQFERTRATCAAVLDFIPGQVNFDTVSPTTRLRYDIFSELYSQALELRRRTHQAATRYTLCHITTSINYENKIFYLVHKPIIYIQLTFSFSSMCLHTWKIVQASVTNV